MWHNMNCVMETEIFTRTWTKTRTRNMTGPGLGPRLGPNILRDQDQGLKPALIWDRDSKQEQERDDKD